MLHFLCCAKLFEDPNSKISRLDVALFYGRRASDYVDCNPKIVKRFVKPATGGNGFFDFLKG